MMCRKHLIFIVIVFSSMGSVSAQPTKTLVYTNRVDNYENRFVIGPKDFVSGGRYKLLSGDSIQFDRLTFVRDVEFPDGRDNSPAVVRGWEYKGTDKTENSWRIIFGKEEGTVPGVYPVYYSFETGGNFERWLLPGGTHRVEGNLKEEIKAVLWANQLDADRLGLKPFNEQQQSPMTVVLAWRTIGKDLNSLLDRYGTRIATQSMLRGPTGMLHMNVEVTGDRVQDVEDSLVIRNNVDLKFVDQLRTQIVVTNRSLAQRYLTNGRADKNKVNSLLTDLINGGSSVLSDYQFTAVSQVTERGCYAISAPWQLLTCGDEYCQFWRIRLGFEVESKGGGEVYELKTEFDIGECKRDEQQFGDDRIVWRTSSKDASEFRYLKLKATPEPQEMRIMEPGVFQVVRSVAPGYSVYEPLPGFSLKNVLDRVLADYVQGIVR
jgi:hypothetical protein